MSAGLRAFAARHWLVALLAALAVGSRLAFLAYIVGTPGFTWVDPDGYLFRAYSLIDPAGDWRWTIEAVRYSGPYVKAPLYPLLLSLFEFSPRGYGLSAAATHALLAGLTTVSVWSLAADLHSRRAAFLAALICALQFSSVASVSVIMQERLYVPLLTAAFALLARALRDTDRFPLLALSGVVFGLAALTRSMPVYFAGPAALLMWRLSDTRRRGGRRAAAFLSGFAAVAAPYTLFISGELDRFVLIENIGAYGVARLDPQGQASFPRSDVEAPTTAQVASFAVRRFIGDPMGFAGDRLRALSGTFRLGGGRWLDTHASFPTASSARLAKVAVHLGGDAPYALLALAAPFGFLVARQRAIAALVALWILVHLGMTVMAGYAGQRFREPIDWALFAFGSCLLCGGARRPSTRELGLALAAFLLVLRGIVVSIGPAIESRADYGISPWEDGADRRAARAEGPAGFKTGVVNGRLDVRLRAENAGRVIVVVRVDGETAADVVVGPEGYRLDFPHPGSRAFVEVSGSGPSGRAALLIEAPSIMQR